MPAGAVRVDRSTVWGNPFIVGKPCGVFPEGAAHQGQAETLVPALTLERSLMFYRDMLAGFLKPEMYPFGHDWQRRFLKRYGQHAEEVARRVFKGATVACWCALDQKCHGDILIQIGNPHLKCEAT